MQNALKSTTLRGLKILHRGTTPNTLKRFQMQFVYRFAQAKIFTLQRISDPLMENGGVSVVHPDILTVGGATGNEKARQYVRKIRRCNGNTYG